MASPKVPSPEPDRRRNERTLFEPLRVRLDRKHEGIAIELSEGGALLQLPVAPPQDREFAIQIEWQDTVVTLQVRVVRAVQRGVQLESATLARTEYYVALEFQNPTGEASAAIKRILKENSAPRDTAGLP